MMSRMSAFSFFVAIAASQPCPVGKVALASLIVRRNCPWFVLQASKSRSILGANFISLHIANPSLLRVSSSDPACKAIVSAWCKATTPGAGNAVAMLGAGCRKKAVFWPKPEQGVAWLLNSPCVGPARRAGPVRSCRLGSSSSSPRIEGREG